MINLLLPSVSDKNMYYFFLHFITITQVEVVPVAPSESKVSGSCDSSFIV